MRMLVNSAMLGTFLIFLLGVLGIFLLAVTASHVNQAQKNVSKPTVSSDGHAIPKREDITCAGTYGHAHNNTALEQEYGKRYIVHNEPETGYVILNGVKRKLKDCWKY